jgi:hypothetical protein
MRKFAATATMVLVTGFGVAAPALAAPATAQAASSCVVHWGTKAKHAGVMVQSKVRNVRAGKHACFDRLVVDIGRGAKPGYNVRYVKQIVQDASGMPIKVKGKGKLLINVQAPAASGFPANSHHLVNVKGFVSLRQVVGAGSFEGVTSIGAGIRVRLPFRVFEVRTAGHQTHLVVDVAHHR